MSNKITGTIQLPNNQKVALANIQAFFKSPKKEEKIGNPVKTNINGEYSIEYTPKTKGNHIFIRVMDNTGVNIVGQSEVKTNASINEEINLILASNINIGISEYEAIEATLTQSLGNTDTISLQLDDLKVISSDSGIGLQKLVNYQKSQSIYQQNQQLLQRIIYALINAKKGNTEEIFSCSNTEFSHIISTAEKNNLISKIELRNLRVQREKYQEIRILQFIQKPAFELKTSMEKLWDMGKIAKPLQNKIAAIYLDTKGDIESFYSKLKADTELSIYEPMIRLLINLHNLTLGNLVLVEKLFTNKAVKRLENLAVWTHDMFLAQLQQPPVNGIVPPEVKGKNETERQFLYIRSMRRMLEYLFPTQSTYGNIFSDQQFPTTLKTDFINFFKSNPEFRFEKDNISQYIRVNKNSLLTVTNKEEFLKEFKSIGLCFSISPELDRYDHIKRLRNMTWGKEKGIYTSIQIIHLGYTDFSRSYTSLGGSKNAAEEIFAAAQHLTNKVQSAVTLQKDLSNLFYVLKTNIQEDPTWKNLFGSGDYCQCKECRSVYSPAAYLTDILHFLQNRKTKNNISAYDILIKRRPDIKNILLNCDNAHTALPYIDLVNEILQNAVLNIQRDEDNNPNTEKSFTYNTTRTTPELNANPENLSVWIYDSLKSIQYPWSLPFDMYTEIGKTYMDHLGIDQANLSRKLKKTDSVIAFNQIGLSLQEGLTLAGNNYDSQKNIFWNTQNFTELVQVPVFIKKSGIEFQELEEILKTKFINADNKITINYKGKCNLDEAEMIGLSPEGFKKIFLFRKLQLKLKISIKETDHILFAVLAKYDTWKVSGKTETWLFEVISDIIQLHKKYKISVDKLCTWFGKIPTSHKNAQKNNSELYEKTFLNKTLEHSDLITLNLNDNRTDLLNAPLISESIKNLISAAIRMDKRDIDLICTPDNFNITKLSIKELSLLFGIGSFCNTIAIPIPYYLYLRKMLEIPVSDPVYNKKIEETYQKLKQNNLSLEVLEQITGNRETELYRLGDEKLKQIKKEIEETITKYNQPSYGTADQTTSLEDLVQQKTSTLFGIHEQVIKNISKGKEWDKKFETGTNTLEADRILHQLHNLSLLLNYLSLDKMKEIRLSERADLSFSFNEQVISFKKVTKICELKHVWSELNDPEASFISFLTTPGSGEKYLQAVTLYTDMNVADVTVLSNIQAEDELEKISYYLEVKAVCKYLGLNISIDFNQLNSLCKRELDAKDFDFISHLAKSRYSTSEWFSIAKKLRDPIREKYRDSLVNYIINYHPSNNVRSIEEIYSHYLIDPEMSACMQSSRILLAISTVQLFIQRCLMNLESEVNQSHLTGQDLTDELNEWEEWKWRKNYRVWEANRKVFLYPENWLEPEWRDDKTPFFKELEEELVQNELNDKNAENVYLSYLKKVGEVSGLEIVALCPAEQEGDYYMLGRTRSGQRKYFLRKYYKKPVQFSAWEKVEMEVEGNHVSLITHENRLYLINIKLTEQRRRTKNMSNDSEGLWYWKIQLEWSVLSDGIWSPKVTTEEYIESTDMLLEAPEGLNITIDKTGKNIFLLCKSNSNMIEVGVFISYAQIGSQDINEAGYTNTMGSFIINPANQSVTTTPKSDELILLLHQSISEFDLHNQRTITNIAANGEVSVNMIELKSNKNQEVSLTTCFQKNGNNIIFDIYRHPFIYQDKDQTFFVKDYGIKYALIQLNYHLTEEIISSIYSKGLHDFLTHYRTKTEILSERNTFLQNYSIISENIFNTPSETFETQIYQPNSKYNWELFFHIPMFIANQLSQDHRFEEAQKWYHYIFNPTVRSDEPSSQRFWMFKPFHDFTGISNIEEILRTVNEESNNGSFDEYEATLQQWEHDPFNPHLIARHRIVAYMKNVVMKYVDNLLAWGDHLFRQDTMESLNEATQIYMLAWNILGKKHEEIPQESVPDKNFKQLDENGLDNFSNSLFARVETSLYHTNQRTNQGRQNYESISSPVIKNDNKIQQDKWEKSEVVLGHVYYSLYFCLPPNAKLLGYWDLLKDRFFNLRNCRNIDGAIRQLPLYEPPIDPALLIKAKQSGLSITDAINDTLYTQLSHYRFMTLVSKAIDYANDVKTLGNALLTALEKKNGEEYSLLRSLHEIKLLESATEIRKRQISELNENKKSLDYGLKMANKRYEYYSSREFMSDKESSQMDLLDTMFILQLCAQTLNGAAAVANQLPNIKSGWAGMGAFFSMGIPTNKGGAILSSLGAASGWASSIISSRASRTGQMASYERRAEDWKQQANLTLDEIEQVNKQIIASEIRISIAEKELENHLLQIEKSKEQEYFIQNKFTNEYLYNWMEKQIKALYFQSYQMAFDMAKKAEKALEYELGGNENNFINYGYWDNSKEGLLSGEKLFHDLKRMEMSYLERNKRLQEVSKTVSLSMTNAIELGKLKATGSCKITLKKFLFDLDFLKHTNRKIKSVSVTIPCISGPYTGIHCTLSTTNPYQSIATSTAQNDAGMFQFNFNDERYLPFEGLKIEPEISFDLELNDKYRSFDYNSIADVLLHINYTAEVSAEEAEIPNLHLTKLLSVKNEFANEWFEARNTKTLNSLQLKEKILPYFVQGKTKTNFVISYTTVPKDLKWEIEKDKLTWKTAHVNPQNYLITFDNPINTDPNSSNIIDDVLIAIEYDVLNN